ncbi:hypothetical protein [Pseudanabaena sp. 'Roaring Creek']|uniref:hypothetical protein n=1 Tax=Pseudanabaena sp. 'Roaring Creek' TaxID=1681830 RepID=UPI0006D79A51|nr:hypothetical protein [Pseudanabaena sp. 'Roaring Creek']
MGKIRDQFGTACGCSYDSCQVNCASDPDGFCCIEHSTTNRLLQVLGINPVISSASSNPPLPYFVKVVAIARFSFYQCQNKRFTAYFPATSATVPSVVATNETDFQCGSTVRLFKVYGSDIGFLGDFGANTVTATIIQACSLPAGTVEDI